MVSSSNDYGFHITPTTSQTSPHTIVDLSIDDNLSAPIDNGLSLAVHDPSADNEVMDNHPVEHLRKSMRPMSIPVKAHPRLLLQFLLCIKKSCPHPLNSIISYDSLTLAHKVFSIAISSNFEPKTYNQAIKFDCWKEAMNAKIQAL